MSSTGSRASSRSSTRSSPPSSSSSHEEQTAQITRWIVDTRTLWPGEHIQDSASEFLALISDDERKNVLRKYHIADARMALASALLKRAYVAKWTGLPWADIRFSRRGNAVHGKPCWNPPQYTRPGRPWPKLDFNVSHQAGLATLAGICVPEAYNSNESEEDQILIGCDIVAPHERCDLAAIITSDFEDYTATFNGIFSDEELFNITYNLPTDAVTLLSGERLSSDTLGRLDRTINADQPLSVTMPDGRVEEFSSDLIIDAKLRQFYTYFCLKEAYIKMVGEGLLAPWIRECEFRNVHAPTAGTAARCSTDGTWGGKSSGGRSYVVENFKNGSNEGVEELEIWLSGEELLDVRTEVQAFEEEYMISTMVKSCGYMRPNFDFPAWEKLNLEQDVLAVARATAAPTVPKTTIPYRQPKLATFYSSKIPVKAEVQEIFPSAFHRPSTTLRHSPATLRSSSVQA